MTRWYACHNRDCTYYRMNGYVMFTAAEQKRCPFCENVGNFSPTDDRVWWRVRAAVLGAGAGVGGALFLGNALGAVGGFFVGALVGYTTAAIGGGMGDAFGEPHTAVDVDRELRRRLI